jgi:hypothetical protein
MIVAVESLAGRTVPSSSVKPDEWSSLMKDLPALGRQTVFDDMGYREIYDFLIKNMTAQLEPVRPHNLNAVMSTHRS